MRTCMPALTLMLWWWAFSLQERACTLQMPLYLSLLIHSPNAVDFFFFFNITEVVYFKIALSLSWKLWKLEYTLHGPKQIRTICVCVTLGPLSSRCQGGRSQGDQAWCVCRGGGLEGKVERASQVQCASQCHSSGAPFLSQEWAYLGIPTILSLWWEPPVEVRPWMVWRSWVPPLAVRDLRAMFSWLQQPWNSVMKTAYDHFLFLRTIIALLHDKMTLKIYSSRCYKIELNVYFKWMAYGSTVC